MSSTGYGRSFASKLIQDGHYEQAIEEATRAIAHEPDDPEHFTDRAEALSELGRHAEAAADYEQALALDGAAQVLETDLVDDAYFSALLAAAREEASGGASGAGNAEAGCARLQRYRAALPAGRHLEDAAEWSLRLRGQLKSEFVKIHES